MTEPGPAPEAVTTRFRMPHPAVMLFAAVAIAALCTWIIPAGEYQRALNEATGRTVVVPGTYAEAEGAPVGFLGVLLAVPRGIAAGADVIATILFVGGAFVVIERLGALGRLTATLSRRLGSSGLLAIPVIATVFAVMGALENMQEEIIALVPVLLVLGRRIRVDPLTMVAASAGAAMIGSAFGPTNPYQAGIALKLAEVPMLEGAGLRGAMWVAGLAVWIAWTLRHARHNRVIVEDADAATDEVATTRDYLALACTVGPIVLYAYGALAWDWGFDHLSAVAILGVILVGVVCRLGAERLVGEFLYGMQALLPAAMIVALARSIALVLADGQVIDTILHAAALPLGRLDPFASALLMVPVQALIHIPVSSVSGQAALTIPIFAPLADLIGLSRMAAVLAYQTGAGLMELLTPTNGALLAVLLAAGVPFQRWIRFAIGGWLLATAIGVIGIMFAIAMQ